MVAGWVDAVGYLMLSRLYTANMTGNTVAIADQAEKSAWHSAWARGFPVLAFFLGVVVCGLVSHTLRATRRAHVTTFAIEAMLLGGALAASASLPLPIAFGSGPFFLLAGLLAGGMGMQNGTLTRIGPLTVFTTHVTGTITKCADSLSDSIVWLVTHTRGRSLARKLAIARAGLRRPSARHAGYLLLLWIGYLAGAVGGVVVDRRVASRALVAPVAVLVALVAVEVRWPVARHPKPEAP